MTLAAAALKVLFVLTRSMGAPPQLFLGMVLLSVVYLFFCLHSQNGLLRGSRKDRQQGANGRR